MALVTHQGPGHRSPAPPAAHLLQLEVASQSLKRVDAVAIYALWRREGNWGYAPCRNSPLREVVGLARLIRLLVSGLPCLRFGSRRREVAVAKRITTELHRCIAHELRCGEAPMQGAFACLEMVWGRVHTVLDSPVIREEAKWSSTPKCRPPRAAGSRCAHCLSGLLKHPVFFRLPRRLTKQRLQATPTPLVMLLQSPSVPTGHEELESSPQSS